MKQCIALTLLMAFLLATGCGSSAPAGYRSATGSIYPGTKLYVGNPPSYFATVLEYPADSQKRLKVMTADGTVALLPHETVFQKDLYIED